MNFISAQFHHTTDEQLHLIDTINNLKKLHNIVILVHNYQKPEIYKIADFIGDSFELSKKAAETDADIIIFCGVKFMAETAKILNPSKKVLLPEEGALCSLASMVTVKDVLNLREKYPDAAVVSYINTSAEVKAVSDICCTSANALKVVNSLPNKQIIFLPDKNLGMHIQSLTDKEIILWNGYCSVHTELEPYELLTFKNERPGAKIVAHPECKPSILKIADYVCSTGAMAKYVKESSCEDFIIVTECGMLGKLTEDVPGKNFYSYCNFCSYMKLTGLNSVLNSILYSRHEINLPEEVMQKARMAITKMLEIS